MPETNDQVQAYHYILNCPGGEHRISRPLSEADDALAEAKGAAGRIARSFIRTHWKSSITHATVTHAEDNPSTTVEFAQNPAGFDDWKAKVEADHQAAEKKKEVEPAA